MAVPFALDTTDLDEARELVGHMIAPFALTPCRRLGYRARVRVGGIGALGVAEVSYTRAVDVDSQAPDDTLILELPVQGHCRIARRGGTPDAYRSIGRGDVHATAPGEPIRTWMSDQNRMIIVKIPAALINPLGDWQHPSCEPGQWAPSPFLSASRIASIERLAMLVFEEAAGAGAITADRALGAELQHIMLALLGAPRRTQADGAARCAEPAVLPRSVRRAQALMIAAPGGGLSLPALAGHCGVSVRTLQQNFREFTGATPSQWWRGHRLDRVHAALRAADADTGVSQAATAYGFYHLGRFAQQYRARFGEPPSETLQRARARMK